MNKEELKELAATLNGIADGKSWEYCCFTGPKEEWFESMIGTDPVSLLARGQGIRLKQQPDPFAELKAAHAAGKKLQHRCPRESKWSDCSVTDTSQDPYCFIFKPECYRIKPDQQKVPLGPGDVPPGSVIGRCHYGDKRPEFWVMVIHCGPNSVSYNNGAIQEVISYCDLNGNDWQIKRPGGDWQPCYKLIDTP